MPQPPRADEQTGLYHALNRGNGCQDVFRKPADFEAFERLLAEGLKRYRVQLRFITLLLAFWATGIAGAAERGFRVVGSAILGPDGKEFVARGINVEGLNYGWPGDASTEVKLIADTWGFNLVRLNCRLLETRKGSQCATPADLDKLVTAFTSRKLVVILEFHDRTGKYYEGEALDKLAVATKELAVKYRDNPYVWFNVQNEPGDGTSLEHTEAWLAVHRRVIVAVREEARSQALVVCDGHFWGQDLGIWKASTRFPVERSAILTHGTELFKFNGKSYGNVVFSIHAYDQWSKGDEAQTQALLTDFVQRAHERKLCVLVGEWGSGIKPGDRYFPTLAKAVPPVAQKLKVGRIAWAWRGNDPFQLTTDGGGQQIKVDATGKPTNLSWYGELVWNDLRAGDGKKSKL